MYPVKTSRYCRYFKYLESYSYQRGWLIEEARDYAYALTSAPLALMPLLR